MIIKMPRCTTEMQNVNAQLFAQIYPSFYIPYLSIFSSNFSIVHFSYLKPFAAHFSFFKYFLNMSVL